MCHFYICIPVFSLVLPPCPPSNLRYHISHFISYYFSQDVNLIVLSRVILLQPPPQNVLGHNFHGRKIRLDNYKLYGKIVSAVYNGLLRYQAIVLLMLIFETDPSRCDNLSTVKTISVSCFNLNTCIHCKPKLCCLMRWTDAVTQSVKHATV